MRLIPFLSLFLTLSLAFEIQKPTIYEDYNLKYNSWFMSEKLDGIRAYWDGNKLYTKNRNEIIAPKWFTKNFPNFELDGELWTKQNDFENIQSIVLSHKEPKEWENISFNIFEVPNIKGNFEDRLAFLKKYLDKNPNQYINIIPQKRVVSKENLESFLEYIIQNSGEGIIIKNPELEYFTGRNNNILKVKKFLDDEAKVIALNLRENGTLKSLVLELENGISFNLGGGFSNKDRENPPKIGDIITFKYYGFTKNGKPKFASFLRVRENE